MNPHTTALRVELKARFDQANALLDEIEHFISTPLANPPTVSPPSPPVRGQRAMPARKASPLKRIAVTPAAFQRGKTERFIREAIASLPATFKSADVAAALASRDADRAKDICNGGRLGYALSKLRETGEITAEGTTQDRRFTKTAKFSAEANLSPSEAAYRDFRKSVKTPGTEE